jgi:hypothetical protein
MFSHTEHICVHYNMALINLLFQGLMKGMEEAGIMEPTTITLNPDSGDLLLGCANTQIYHSVLV